MLISLTATGRALRENFSDTLHVAWEIFQVIIPISIGLRILAELDWIRYLALPLTPVMNLVGLPADLGLVWATGIMVNHYSALVVLAGLLPTLPVLTQAQTSVLALMLLFAHSLPAEGAVAQRCGVSFLVQCCIRIVAALFGGMLVQYLCMHFAWLQESAYIAFQATDAHVALQEWAIGECINLLGIFCIIYCVMLVQRFLQYCKASDLLGVILRPLLHALGLGSAAATTVIIGMVAGLLYGSGIIIQESRNGKLTHHEIFAVLTLMALAHALIEDTLLMLLIDANLLIILFLRAAIAIFVGVALNQIYKRFVSGKNNA